MWSFLTTKKTRKEARKRKMRNISKETLLCLKKVKNSEE